MIERRIMVGAMGPFTRRRRRILAALVATALTVPALAAAMDRRLAERLDAATADAVWQVVSSARASGVPAEPLVATALEGASKRARRDRIVAAVKSHAAALTTAQLALGKQSSQAEVVAGAGALMSGVPPDTLARLRVMRPKGSLVVPLVVLADLVTRQVPIGTASSAVLHASQIGARDTELLRLRAGVEGDIRRGLSPAEATRARLDALGGPRMTQRPMGGIRTREQGAP